MASEAPLSRQGVRIVLTPPESSTKTKTVRAAAAPSQGGAGSTSPLLARSRHGQFCLRTRGVEWCNSGATAEQRHGLSEAYHTLGFKKFGENLEERLWGLRTRYPLFLVDDEVWHPTAMRARAGEGLRGRGMCVFECLCLCLCVCVMERARERVLFIGTQFSILYTSMYSPAEAATPRA